MHQHPQGSRGRGPGAGSPHQYSQGGRGGRGAGAGSPHQHSQGGRGGWGSGAVSPHQHSQGRRGGWGLSPHQHSQGGRGGWGSGAVSPDPHSQGGRGGRGSGALSPDQHSQGGRGGRGAGAVSPHQHSSGSRGGCHPRGGRGRGRQGSDYQGGRGVGHGQVGAPQHHEGTGMDPQQYDGVQWSGGPAAQNDVGQIISQFQQLTAQCRPPLRPDKGTYGQKCMVRANHFIANLSLPKANLCLYDVTIKPEVTSQGVNRAIIKQLADAGNLGHLPAYDGKKFLYTVGSLPFSEKLFKITLKDDKDGAGGQRKERSYEIVINYVSNVDVRRLELFLTGMQRDAPQDIIQMFDIILRQSLTQRYTPVGRSFYPEDLRRSPIGEGLECRRGFYQSIRPTQQGLSLNIDMSSAAFIQDLPVINFIGQLLGRNVSGSRLSMDERDKVEKTLTGLKVEVTHMRRMYRISGLTKLKTEDLDFPVVRYFKETYEWEIQNPDLPCLEARNPQNPIYLPIEVCKIVKGQRYSRRLTGEQTRALLRATSDGPKEREAFIQNIVSDNAYGKDEYAQKFGMNISSTPASVEARILPSPQLIYHDQMDKMKGFSPSGGCWNMGDKKMFNGGKVTKYGCINFARNVSDHAATKFCEELAGKCQNYGIDFALESPLYITSCYQSNEMVMKLVQLFGRGLDLLIAILPDDKHGTLYGELKRICETDLGLVSQCCLSPHVLENVWKKRSQYMSNVALKINVKLGGTNTVLLDAIPHALLDAHSKIFYDVPTIIFGADVTHPSAGDVSSPSIAAVVASQDRYLTKYNGLVCAQAHREEIILNLYTEHQDRGVTHCGGMIMELLRSFKKATGQKPMRIIFYRDGVSEGQFNQVLFHEVTAIRKACAALEKGYNPPVTFVVVQKRHHTRLFPDHVYQNPTKFKTNENILPGTVVDTTICHPFEFDFYLCSHAGIKGTSRPTHYHVLWDENEFTADSLQALTYNLCYTYARCTRSVSIVPAAYYAHLAAFRARCYMGTNTSDDGGAVNSLPALKDNIKRVMFFC